MKVSKRILAILLTCILFVGFVQPVGVAASATGLTKITGLKITTADKAKYLKLTWTKQPAARGYQVYRSTSGKTGSYSRVAVVSKAAFADKELKSSTAYYYKVRAYAKQNGKTVYGAFAKADLSTHVTTNYVAKRFCTAYKATAKFFANAGLSSGKSYDLFEDAQLSRYGVPYPGFYNPSRYRTKKEAVKELNRSLSKKLATELVDGRFFYINGELYFWTPLSGAEEYLVIDQISADIQKRSDRVQRVTIHTIWRYTPEDARTADYPMKMKYENGRWVFDNSVIWNDIFYPYGYSYYT